MDLIVEHGRADILRVTNQVVANDDYGQTCGRHILLSAGVKDTELADVDRAGEDAGADISYQRNIAGIGQLMINRAVDRVVHADVEVVRIGSEGRLVELRNIGESFVLGGSDNVRVAVASAFLIRFLRPLTGDDIVSLAGLGRKVQRNCRKLGRCAALKEQHLIVIGNVHYFSEKRLCLFDDTVVNLGTMGHLHDTLTAALIIEHFVSSFSQYALRQHRRTCRKIINSCHYSSLLNKNQIFHIPSYGFLYRIGYTKTNINNYMPFRLLIQ